VNIYRTAVFSIFISFTVSCQNQTSKSAGTETGDAKTAPSQVQVIFDTDMGPDYDDVGAITMLHAFADEGSANILATIASTKYEGVAEVLDVLNTYFNRPDIPVGVPKQEASELRDEQHWSDTLRKNYPHSVENNMEVSDAVELYRSILAQQPDTSVTIITVGFLTNISNLLKSRPDEYSPMSGKELVAKKVKKLVSMAGAFPEGSEFNIKIDASASGFTFENFNRPVIFSGFEIGKEIKTGIPLISDTSIKNSPVKDVFRICIPMSQEDSAGRMSWDETAVLVGVKGHQPFYTLTPGEIVIDGEGYNKWDATKNKHQYIVAKAPPSEVQSLINKMIMHQPVKK
jgi:inosine-uridine nucleoside N-ribohydrolase